MYTYVHIRIYIHAYTCIRMYIRVCVYTPIHMYIHTCIHTYIYSNLPSDGAGAQEVCAVRRVLKDVQGAGESEALFPTPAAWMGDACYSTLTAHTCAQVAFV